jgi:Plasmid pRiA4b ORF-3-like protein
MDWDDRVPHRFILAGDILRRVAPGEALDAKRERNWRLDSAFYPDKTFWYCYGRADDWRLRIELEDYVDGEPLWRYPRCVGGEGASPPRLGGTFSVASANRRLWRSLKRR